MNAETNFMTRLSPVVARPEAFLDAKTGLMIAAYDLVLPDGTDTFDHHSIDKALKEFRCAGHADWRCWNDEEASLFIDRSKHDPAADPILNLKPAWYWTTTKYKPDEASYAWAVHFRYGDVSIYHRNSRFRVRAVRSARQ